MKLVKRILVFIVAVFVLIGIAIALIYHDYKNFCHSTVPIFAYHRVEDASDVYTMPPKMFEEQMIYLKSKGYTTMNLDEYAAARKRGDKLHKKMVLIFDDGYIDNLENAAPIMQKYGFTGSMFMAVRYEGWPGYFDWHTQHDLLKYGWEIGSHTYSHKPLTDLKPAEVKEELLRSKAYIQGIYNPPGGITLSYPSGKTNDAVVKQVEEAGYIAAVSGDVGINTDETPLCRLKRVNVFQYKSMDLDMFKYQLYKALFTSWGEYHGFNVTRWVDRMRAILN